MIFKFSINPVTKKRLLKFREVKRAYISLFILILLYGVSLCSELICNASPLYVRYNGKSYFPAFKFYSQNLFTGNGENTRADYKRLNACPLFKEDTENFMIFPPVPFGPFESINPESIDVSDNISLSFIQVPKIASVNIRKDYSVASSSLLGQFIDKKNRENIILSDYFTIPEDMRLAVNLRFENQNAPRLNFKIKSINGKKLRATLSTFTSRKKPPKTVRIRFSEIIKDNFADNIGAGLLFNKKCEPVSPGGKNMAAWDQLDEKDKSMLKSSIKRRCYGPVDSVELIINDNLYRVEFAKKDVNFPFPPVKGHPMGIDGAGRDVFARILYGLRTSMSFGIMLVACSMIIGITAGAIQGYYGGIVDIISQRCIEIWSAIPFLYVMIFMGSVYGRSFFLLLLCYGLFNWIGISYYMRAEFLRLRKEPFVEAAECMGLSSKKIIFKHILPNAMVPVITFFPFSLVSAIGALAALDYLGFGLPPPTPSWGELLYQAQQYRWAWWLILYPSTALFVVMLCGVFVGEGVRNAFDPKRYISIE